MVSILNKEKKCVSITSEHIVPKEKPSLVRSAIKILIKDVFANEPIWLMPIILIIYIVCLPVTIFELFKGYRDEKNVYNELVEKFYHFNGFSGKKNIVSLWHEYGLDPKKFRFNEEELANCLSRWISILYESPHHMSAEEILQRFKIQQKHQAEAYASAYENSGAMITFVDATIVVVDSILELLPNYSSTNSHENKSAHITQEIVNSTQKVDHDYKKINTIFPGIV